MRYVVVEFFGGPRDGERALFDFPPRELYDFAPLPGSSPGLIYGSATSSPEAPEVPHFRYRMVRPEHGYAVLELSDAEIRAVIHRPRDLEALLRQWADEYPSVRYDYVGRAE